MNEYPFIKCLNPRFLTNRYTGKEILVECGKCESCLLKKSLASTTRCKLEDAFNKYAYFVTLTYRNEDLPLMQLIHRKYVPESDVNVYDVVSVSSGEVYGSITFKHLDEKVLYKKCGTPENYLPTFDKRHVQLFLKRLRKRFSYEKIRYFLCGELGPVHFRPHYHLKLWFNEEQTAENIIEAVRQEWPYGRVDVSLCNGKSSGYVSSYINGNMYLPRVFKLPKSRPFSNHSFYLGESVFQGAGEEMDESEYERIASRRFYGHGINTDVVLFRSLKTRLMPKCKGYCSLNEHERILSYQSYEIIRKWTQEDKPIKQARFIADYVKYFDFYHEINEVNELLQLFRHGLGYYNYVQSLDSYVFIQPKLVDYRKFERMVYMIILRSRSFLIRYCSGNMTYGYISKRLKFIDGFYKYLEHENLKQQLKLEAEFSKTSDKDNIRFFHHNKFSVDELITLPEHKRLTSSKKTMFKSFMKHKELNDKNLFFNYM